ncbi:DMT family transporter [Pseudoponticoccus marisrubri]|uniref:DMT family transporter n=1 Tax=Pseudoponticoccus marisrubri TaxID=1685382 RepID=UPI0034626ED4
MSEAQRGHLAMLTFSAVVAWSYSLGGLVAPLIDPGALTALRFVMAAAVLWALAAVRPVPRRVLAAPWRYALLAGLYAVYFILMFEGLKTADPVNMSAVFTSNPALAALFGWLLMRQVTTGRMALAISIGLAGALWVIFRADWQAFLAFRVGRGEAIFFLGCVGHGLYAPLLRRLNQGEPAVPFSAMVLSAGALITGIWSVPAIMATDWAALPPLVWGVAVYLALPATAFSFLLVRYATLRLPAAKVMAYTYLVPSWVILWEMVLGHDLPPGLVLPGIGLTVLSLVLLLKDEVAPEGAVSRDPAPRAVPGPGNARTRRD